MGSFYEIEGIKGIVTNSPFCWGFGVVVNQRIAVYRNCFEFEHLLMPTQHAEHLDTVGAKNAKKLRSSHFFSTLRSGAFKKREFQVTANGRFILTWNTGDLYSCADGDTKMHPARDHSVGTR